MHLHRTVTFAGKVSPDDIFIQLRRIIRMWKTRPGISHIYAIHKCLPGYNFNRIQVEIACSVPLSQL